MQRTNLDRPDVYRTDIFVDCEFNSYKGELISMALVDERNNYWYRAVGCANPDPWVAKHVMPVLNTPLVTMEELQSSLEYFLNRYESIHLIADWPEDIQHFCAALITGPGTRISYPSIIMESRSDIDGDKSEIPHNALADAKAIRRDYEQKMNKNYGV